MDVQLEVLKLQKTPKIFFEQAEKERREEMLKGSVNYFHSLRVAIAINLVRYPSGALAYFISAPARKPETLRGVAAQFNRWDIYGARESVDFAHLWPAGAGDGEGADIIRRNYQGACSKKSPSAGHWFLPRSMVFYYWMNPSRPLTLKPAMPSKESSLRSRNPKI